MKPICFVLDTDEGEKSFSLPSKWAICDGCAGNGVHDHPAFSNGISQEQFDEDEDFRDAYFAGRYDVRCEECNGSGKMLVPDTDALTPDQRKTLELYEEKQAEDAREARADAYTRRMENGGY